jgi:hypothetical protein
MTNSGSTSEGLDGGSRDGREGMGDAEVERVSRQVAGHLATLGIEVGADASVETLRAIADAVEDFEEAVRARGGDLMVDEPPRGEGGQPDDRDFALPRPRADETAAAYLNRLEAATARVLEHGAPGS